MSAVMPILPIEHRPNKDIMSEIDKPRDAINPSHYRSDPSGVECITVTEHRNFCIGNAMKYLWRAGLKNDDAVTDLRKSIWYIEREIQRLEKAAVR